MALGGADLDGIVAFHSALPLGASGPRENIKASILVINGADDSFLKPETVAAFIKELAEQKVDLTYTQLAGVKHSYTNKKANVYQKKFKIPNLEYNQQADKRSWSAMATFFRRVFAKGAP